MTERQWLDSLKIGDEIAVNDDGRYSIHKLDNVTLTQVFTKYHKVRRRDGRGYDSQGKPVKIAPATPELKQSIEDAFDRKKLRGVISLALPTASTHTLRDMVKALERAEETEKDSPGEAIGTQKSGKRWRPGR